MNLLLRALDRFRWPRPDDIRAVRRMSARQWAGIATRTDTYLDGYSDRPESNDRAQRRAEWIAGLAHWPEAASVMEVGCGAGRNLAVLRRHHPALSLLGADICPEAVETARHALPEATIACLNLYEVEDWHESWRADLVLTLGVLSHLEPSVVPGVVQALARRARKGLLFVEHVSPPGGRLLKGPAAWGPTLKATGDYLLWTVSVGQLTAGGGLGSFDVAILPEDLRSPGATAALWVDTSR